MGRIHLIQPMGGRGVRFFDEGFESPKPLIMLNDRPFFYWAVRSVVKFCEVADVTFVVLREHVEGFDIDSRIKEYFPEARIVVIPEVLNGAVLTCREGSAGIEDDEPLLFNDCDHAFYCPQFYDHVSAGDFGGEEGALLTFRSDSPAFSYVKYDGEGRVIGTVEKQVVSNDAICGAYYFRSRGVFESGVERYLKACSYSEYFVSGVYNELAKENGRIKVFSLDEHISFGTPKEYDEAAKSGRLGELLL